MKFRAPFKIKSSSLVRFTVIYDCSGIKQKMKFEKSKIEKMKKKKIIKIGVITVIIGIVIAGAVGFYMFNMPHRDVQSAKADFHLNSSDIVDEYLSNKDAANEKYLAADGDSKILEITGQVAKISDDFDGNKVVLLKSSSDKAGVSATFTPETNENTTNLQVGEKVTVKGVIRSGAAYDSDLELYENVILEKSDVVNK
jgi:hypothetical protein